MAVLVIYYMDRMDGQILCMICLVFCDCVVGSILLNHYTLIHFKFQGQAEQNRNDTGVHRSRNRGNTEHQRKKILALDLL